MYYWRWNTPAKNLSMSSTVEVVQEGTDKNLDDKLTLYNIQGHFTRDVITDIFGWKLPSGRPFRLDVVRTSARVRVYPVDGFYRPRTR
jgi:hypothetical protein